MVSPDWWLFTPRITPKCLRCSQESRIMTMYFVLIAICVLCAVAYRIHLTKVRRQAARSKAQAALDEFATFAEMQPLIAAAQLSTPRARHRPPAPPRPVGMSRAHAAPYTGTPSPAPSDDLLTAAVLYSAFSTPPAAPAPSYSGGGGGDFSGAGASGSWDSSSSRDSGSSCSASSSD